MRKYLISILALVLMVFVCAPAFADLTITSEEGATWGTKRIRMMNVAFDSSYASGGEDFSYPLRHMANVDQVIVHGKGSYTFEYDKTNKKLKVFSNAPPIVFDEPITTTANSGATLVYPLAWPLSVTGSSGYGYQWAWSDTAAIGGVTTLGSGQYALNAGIVAGERTGVTTGPNTGTFYVTYVTQAWDDVYKLLVQNLPVMITGAAGASTSMTGSGNTIWAFGYAKTGSTLYTPTEYGDSRGHQNSELGIQFGSKYWGSQSGTSTTYLRHTQHGNETTAWTTFLKWPMPTSGNTPWLYSHSETGVSPITAGVSRVYMRSNGPLLMNRVAGFVLSPYTGIQTVVGNATEMVAGVSNVRWSPNIPNVDFLGTPMFTAAGSLSGTTNVIYGNYLGDPTGLSAVTPIMHYVWGNIPEIPNVKMLEVPAGTDLSALTDVKVIMIGR